MSDQVELSVRSQLKKIIEDLEAIHAAQLNVKEGLAQTGAQVGETYAQQVKKTEGFLSSLRGMSGRVADQLRGDFRSLLAINALTESVKLSEQFKGSIRETISLSDAIRKLGGSFGIAKKDFSTFQSGLVKGLGEVGLSSDVAAQTLQGLMGTQVRGQSSILGYARTSGQLASVTKEQGREGDIAKGIAKVIQARGGDVNDPAQLKAVAEDLRRAFTVTGKGPTELLRGMESLFTNMSKDFRKTISTRGLVNLAAAETQAGPNSTKFLEEFLGKSPIARQAMEAQGFKGVIGEGGIDIEKFRKAASAILERIGGDPRMAAQTLGLSEDAAEGFIRLSESLDRVKAAQEGIEKATGDLATQYRQSMGMGESFRASVNRIKKVFSEPLAAITQGATDMLSKASESDLGSAGVVAGGGVLAALLAGGGLRGIGKGLGLGGMAGGLLKGAAAEQITGEKVQPVYVVNAAEISAGGALGDVAGAAGGKMGKLASVAGFLGKAGLVGAAGAAGYGVGSMIEGQLPTIEGTTEEGFTGGAIERLIFKIDQMLTKVGAGSGGAAQFNKAQKVIVELNKKDLKESKQPTRGASF